MVRTVSMLCTVAWLSKVGQDYLIRVWMSVHVSVIFVTKVPEWNNSVSANVVLIPLVLCIASS